MLSLEIKAILFFDPVYFLSLVDYFFYITFIWIVNQDYLNITAFLVEKLKLFILILAKETDYFLRGFSCLVEAFFPYPLLQQLLILCLLLQNPSPLLIRKSFINPATEYIRVAESIGIGAAISADWSLNIII